MTRLTVGAPVPSFMTEPISHTLPRYWTQFDKLIFLFLILTVVGLTFSIAVSSIGLSLAILTSLIKVFSGRTLTIARSPLDYFFLAYVAVEILVTIFALDPWQSFVNSKRLLLISVVYLIASYVNTEKKAITFLGLLVGVTGFLSLLEILKYFELRAERLFLFQHYMTTGGIKMTVLLLLIPFLLHEETPRKIRVFGTLFGIPTFLALILTFTRSSWLGFIAGCLAVGFLKNRYVILPVLVLVILFLLFAPLGLRERAYSIIDLNHPHNVGRVYMWTTGIQIFKDHPILGVGDIDLQSIYSRYKAPEDIEPGGHLHNNVLMWLVTLGLLGCTVLIVLFGRILALELSIFRRWKNNWLRGSLALGAVAVFLGFHVNGMFEWNFGDQEIILLLWFSVGLGLAAERLASNLKEKTETS